MIKNVDVFNVSEKKNSKEREGTGVTVHPDGIATKQTLCKCPEQNAAFLPLPQLPTQSCTCVSTVGVQAFFNAIVARGDKEWMLFYCSSYVGHQLFCEIWWHMT